MAFKLVGNVFPFLKWVYIPPNGEHITFWQTKSQPDVCVNGSHLFILISSFIIYNLQGPCCCLCFFFCCKCRYTRECSLSQRHLNSLCPGYPCSYHYCPALIVFHKKLLHKRRWKISSKSSCTEKMTPGLKWLPSWEKWWSLKSKGICVRAGIEAIEINYTLSIWCVCNLQSTFYLFVFEDANNQYVGMEIF